MFHPFFRFRRPSDRSLKVACLVVTILTILGVGVGRPQEIIIVPDSSDYRMLGPAEKAMCRFIDGRWVVKTTGGGGYYFVISTDLQRAHGLASYMSQVIDSTQTPLPRPGDRVWGNTSALFFYNPWLRPFHPDRLRDSLIPLGMSFWLSDGLSYYSIWKGDNPSNAVAWVDAQHRKGMELVFTFQGFPWQTAAYMAAFDSSGRILAVLGDDQEFMKSTKFFHVLMNYTAPYHLGSSSSPQKSGASWPLVWLILGLAALLGLAWILTGVKLSQERQKIASAVYELEELKQLQGAPRYGRLVDVLWYVGKVLGTEMPEVKPADLSSDRVNRALQELKKVLPQNGQAVSLLDLVKTVRATLIALGSREEALPEPTSILSVPTNAAEIISASLQAFAITSASFRTYQDKVPPEVLASAYAQIHNLLLAANLDVVGFEQHTEGTLQAGTATQP